MGEFDYLVPKKDAPAQSNSAGEFAQYIPHQQGALDKVRHTVKQGLRNTAAFANYMGPDPLGRGVPAILGATQRAGQSALVGENPLSGVADPEGADEVTHHVERNALNAWNAHTPTWLHGSLPTENEPWKRAALDFVTQTGTDPATYIPGLDAFTVLGRAARFARLGKAAGAAAHVAGKVVPQAAKDWVSNTVEHAKSNLSTSHDALKGFLPEGLNLVRAREGRTRHLHQQRLDEYQPQLQALEPAIHHLDASLRAHNLTGIDLRDLGNHLLLSREDRQTLKKMNELTDKVLWRDATHSVRRKMLARGYKPSLADRNLPTTNLISTDFGEHYIPEQTLYDKASQKEADAVKGFSYNRGGVKHSKFDKKKTNTGSQDPLYDRLVNRVENSAYLESKRRGEQSIISDLGLKPSQAPRTNERISKLQQRLASTPRSSPQYRPLSRKLQKYSDLLGRQTKAADADLQKRDRFLQPNAAMVDEKLPGVLSSEGTSQGRAARDLRFLGRDTSNAFTDGKLDSVASPTLTRAKSVAADALERRLKGVSKATASSALRSSMKLSSLGLSNQKRASLAAQRVADRAQKYGESAEKRVTQALSGDPAYKAMTGKYRNKTLAASKARDTSSISRPAFEAAKPTNMSSVLKPLENMAKHSQNAADKISVKAQTKRSKLQDLVSKNENIGKVEERVKQDTTYGGNIHAPQALHDRLFGDKVHVEPGVAEKLGSGLANVMFSNPLPHLAGNIFEQQAFAGGGPKALLAGIGESVKLARGNKAAKARLEASKEFGAQHERGYESATPPKSIPGKVIHALQHGLTLGHEGQASELFQRYIKAGETPENAAEEVRKTFGRPYESSKEAQKGKQVGAAFANWALSTVPRSTKKALSSARGRNRLLSYSRAVGDANHDVFEPEYGVDLNPGGFASRATSLALRPLSYLASPSLDNAIHGTATDEKLHPGDIVKSALPFAGTAMDLAGQPLNRKQRMQHGYKKLPWYLKLLMLSGGYYTHAETPHQKFMREMRREGLVTDAK